jgi:hypothetical protein
LKAHRIAEVEISESGAVTPSDEGESTTIGLDFNSAIAPLNAKQYALLTSQTLQN